MKGSTSGHINFDKLTQGCIEDFKNGASESRLLSSLKVLSKVVIRNQYDATAFRDVLCGVIPHSFLNNTISCKDGADLEISHYRNAAVTVLGFLCHNKEFILNSNMDQFANLFKEFILGCDNESDNFTELADCICSVLIYNSGQEANTLCKIVQNCLHHYINSTPFPVCKFTKHVRKLEDLGCRYSKSLHDCLVKRILHCLDLEFETLKNSEEFEDWTTWALEILMEALENKALTEKEYPYSLKIIQCFQTWVHFDNLRALLLHGTFIKILTRMCVDQPGLSFRVYEMFSTLTKYEKKWMWLNCSIDLQSIIEILARTISQSNSEDKWQLIRQIADLVDIHSLDDQVMIGLECNTPFIMNALNAILNDKPCRSERTILFELILSMHKLYFDTWISAANGEETRYFFSKTMFYISLEMKLFLTISNLDELMFCDPKDLTLQVQVFDFLQKFVLVYIEDVACENYLFSVIDDILTLTVETSCNLVRLYDLHSEIVPGSAKVLHLWSIQFPFWCKIAYGRFFKNNLSRDLMKFVPEMFELFHKCMCHHQMDFDCSDCEDVVASVSNALDAVSDLPAVPKGGYSRFIAEHFVKTWTACSMKTFKLFHLPLVQSCRAVHAMARKKGYSSLKEEPIFDSIVSIFHALPKSELNSKYFNMNFMLADLAIGLISVCEYQVNDSNKNTMEEFLEWTLRLFFDIHQLQHTNKKYNMEVRSKYSSSWPVVKKYWKNAYTNLFSNLNTNNWMCEYMLECDFIPKMFEYLGVVDRTGLDDVLMEYIGFIFEELLKQSNFSVKISKMFIRCGATNHLKKFRLQQTSTLLADIINQNEETIIITSN